MSYGEGQKIYIFKTLDSISYDNDEKLEAIKFVVEKNRYNNIVKEDLWDAIKWLLYLREEEQRDESHE